MSQKRCAKSDRVWYRFSIIYKIICTHYTYTMAFERRRIHMQKPKRSQLWVILFFFLTILILGFFWVKWVGETVVKSWNYNLEKWVTMTQIPEILWINIGNTRYKLWLRYFAPSLPKLQSGTYKVSKSTTLSNVITGVLTKPIYTDITITILPGWNMYDIDSYLSDKKILPTWAFLIAARDNFSSFEAKYSFLKWRMSMEGFLYPDTYRILPTADAYMIIDKLLGEWGKRIGTTYEKLGTAAYENLILASIVEREERKSSEKAKVADILAKRVKEWIAMWADATVCYGYAKTQKQCTPEFIGSVIGIKHPYNTRNKQGYPPTPISSVSDDTWEAVLRDDPSPYYYYLHDTDGIIHYAKTNIEHAQNKKKYLP